METAPSKSLSFQLVQSEIDLTWCLLNLADGLKAENRERDAGEAIRRPTCTLLKAERYARDLAGPESLAASSSLRILKDVIATIVATG
jgi:hypothetical protein